MFCPGRPVGTESRKSFIRRRMGIGGSASGPVTGEQGGQLGVLSKS